MVDGDDPTCQHHQLFLIRHGETVDNVAGLYAGIRDSALTNHGVQQALRLAQYFVTRDVKFTHVFSSNLQRAYKTAESLTAPQELGNRPEVIQVQELREQDFGFYEGKPFFARSSESAKSGKDFHRASHRDEPDFQDVESKESMAVRANKFIDERLSPILNTRLLSDGSTIAIVSHGIMLSNLWRCLLRRQPSSSIIINPELLVTGKPLVLEHLGGWSNTGFLELHFRRINASLAPVLYQDSIGSTAKGRVGAENENYQQRITSTDQHQDHADTNDSEKRPWNQASSPEVDNKSALQQREQRVGGVASTTTAPTFTITIHMINSREHLKGLKRTGGGVGSSKFDEGQTSIKSFFKRQKTEK